ncbi:MAG TPA: DUF2752 domain-containing protein [Gaiellales bacterium]|nr:DUF2752 domain-containing protein [Gaiellales bacterium]
MVPQMAIARAAAGDRMRYLGLMAGLLLWLTYTRLYWVLHTSHVAMPTCPFFLLTGHPCPFCGGTRSFAYMWQGDLADAVRLYPLGPAFFVGSLLGTAGLASGAITGRTWSVNLTSAQWKLLSVGAASALAVSWALKWFVLGN